MTVFPPLVNSEIGELKRVLLHMPGNELTKVTENNKHDFLFDEKIDLKTAQAHYKAYIELLKSKNVEIVLFDNCLRDVLNVPETRDKLIDEVLALTSYGYQLRYSLKRMLEELPSDMLASLLIEGINKKDVAYRKFSNIKSFVFSSMDNSDYLLPPVPNLYFQRDPWFFIGNVAVLSTMKYQARNRETIYAKYILENHPLFKETHIVFGNTPEANTSSAIEGGDVLVLNSECIAIGISQRTNAGTIELLGKKLAKYTNVKRIIAIDVPKERAYMHLDTILTMVDKDAFIVYKKALEYTRLWQLNFDENGTLNKTTEHKNVFATIQSNLEIENIKIIEAGGGEEHVAELEQWNDGANMFCLSPGHVVAYKDNIISNRLLRNNGITVHEIDGSELGKGRGGPRCMSLPLNRVQAP